MIRGNCEIVFGGQRLNLLPQLAVHWAAEKTVFVADVHLGKAATFRAGGVPVPGGSTARDLSRLTQLIDITAAKRLIVLGDLFHAKVGRTQEMLDAVAAWRKTLPEISMLLIRGNHDRAAGRVPGNWRMDERDECHVIEPFQLMHHAKCAGDRPSLAGHIHPVVHVQDFDRSCIRVPCFVQDEMTLLLPAFGTFTGGGAIEPTPQRRIFLATPQRIVRMKSKVEKRNSSAVA